jgi:hypothetical protein
MTPLIRALLIRALKALPVSALVCAGAILWSPGASADPTAPGLCDPATPPANANSCLNQPPQTWPPAAGNFTSPGEPGWIFFKLNGFGGNGCGLAPDGTVGCDAVPARSDDGAPLQAGQPGPPGSYSCDGQLCPLPPPGGNQIVVGPQQPAEYAQADAPTFTRDVDVLRPGYRLDNGDASCIAGYQGTVSCSTGGNGFTLSGLYAILERPIA